MKLVALIVCSTLAAGCAGEYRPIDRDALHISDNARVTAQSLVPDAAKVPGLADHLALAEEIYQKQLEALKDRRTRVRGRKRALGAWSFASLAVTALGVGAAAMAPTSTPDAARHNLTDAGYGALGGLAAGTVLEVASYMQEEPATIDDKIHHLQTSYDHMLEQLRALGDLPADDDAPGARPGTAQMGAVIEAFISEAMQINVKG